MGPYASFETDHAPGIIDVGAVFDHWMTHDFRVGVHPATLFASFDAVAAVGGWMALPGSEDTALLLSLNATHPGYLVDDVGLIYRKWDKQLTAQPNHRDGALRSLRCEAIRRRVELLLQQSQIGRTATDVRPFHRATTEPRRTRVVPAASDPLRRGTRVTFGPFLDGDGATDRRGEPDERRRGRWP